MNQSGITIFMDIPPSALADRLIKSKTVRPLIRGKSLEELTQFIHDSLEKRNPFYLKAMIRVTGTHDLDDIVIQEIKKIT
jgi:shikimate kinase